MDRTLAGLRPVLLLANCVDRLIVQLARKKGFFLNAPSEEFAVVVPCSLKFGPIAPANYNQLRLMLTRQLHSLQKVLKFVASRRE